MVLSPPGVQDTGRESVMGNRIANEIIYRLEWTLSQALSRTKTTNQFVAYCLDDAATISPPATVYLCPVVFRSGPLFPVQISLLNGRCRLDYEFSSGN